MPNCAALGARARNVLGEFIFPEGVQETPEQADALAAQRVAALSRRDFMLIRNIGPTTLQEVTGWLRERGCTWRDDT